MFLGSELIKAINYYQIHVFVVGMGITKNCCNFLSIKASNLHMKEDKNFKKEGVRQNLQ